VTEPTATSEDRVIRHHRRATYGALGDDLSKAVELISSRLQIRGSAAYKILREAAEGAQLSVREMACVVVEAPGAPDQDMSWLEREKRSGPEVGKPRQPPS
jgi:hypothetical protein